MNIRSLINRPVTNALLRGLGNEICTISFVLCFTGEKIVLFLYPG